jgi:5-methylcytosine-specific restriction endonuclease McrA
MPRIQYLENKSKARRAIMRIYRPFKKGRKPSDKTCLEVVGCTCAEFELWIVSKWKEGWTWQNYGSTNYGCLWNFDHIRPLSKWLVLDETERKEANLWSNLQPMCARENDSKGARA